MPQPRKPFKAKDIKRMISLYKKGKTLAEIGAEYECSPSTVRNRLLEEQVEMRPRGKRAAA